MKPSVVVINPQIMSGKPCFLGTRVPVQALFDYLAGGHSLADFLKDFPSVKKSQARRAIAEDSSYAKREYGVTDKELDAFVKRISAKNAHARRAGKMRRYTGDFKAAIGD